MPPFPYLHCLAVFFACLLSVAAGETPAKGEFPPPLQLPVPASSFAESRADWYGVYYDGTKVGWALESLVPAVIEGQAGVTYQ